MRGTESGSGIFQAAGEKRREKRTREKRGERRRRRQKKRREIFLLRENKRLRKRMKALHTLNAGCREREAKTQKSLSLSQPGLFSLYLLLSFDFAASLSAWIPASLPDSTSCLSSTNFSLYDFAGKFPLLLLSFPNRLFFLFCQQFLWK